MPLELNFVTAEEAAKWPVPCQALLRREEPNGELRYHLERRFGPVDRFYSWSHFARLPDTLPELEGKDG